MTISQLLDWASNGLKATSDTPRLDAKILFRHLTQFSEVELITRSNQTITSDIELSYKAIIRERIKGVPVAYLTGTKEFWSLEFSVTTDTLIPRPETELLVETALALIDSDSASTVLDLGTGTGAIAIAIANSRPKAMVTGLDSAKAALEVAIKNAENHHLTNVKFCHSDWFEKLDAERFTIIVSNPPYIRENDPHLQHVDISYEPDYALVSGEDGLDDLKIIIARASGFLNNGGWLLTEHGYDQAEAVDLLFQGSGFGSIKNIKDLSQLPRVTMGQKT